MSADEYTPTKQVVKAAYCVYFGDSIEDGAAFDRFLAAHDAEVARAAAEKAWDKSADRWYQFCQDEAATSDPDLLPTQPVNPYRKVATDE